MRHDASPSAHAVVESPIGNLSIAITEERVTSLEWTDAPPGRDAEHVLLDAAARQLAAYFDDPTAPFDLPLAPAGSAFERAVWRAMCAIPVGQTLSYGDIGRTLGQPARSVGGACGRNPIPIIIPCHRVVGADGRMVGYSGRGGLETKQWLLRHEGALLL
jgi:methylated-DNA-[protein]-cysteine S-methyltransferase